MRSLWTQDGVVSLCLLYISKEGVSCIPCGSLLRVKQDVGVLFDQGKAECHPLQGAINIDLEEVHDACNF